MCRIIGLKRLLIPHSIYPNTQDLDAARTTGKYSNGISGSHSHKKKRPAEKKL
jgi:hypothetical protein